MSVIVSGIAGYALAVAITLAIRDLPGVAKSAQPALDVLESALGLRAGRAVMAFAVAAMWFCGLSSITSASRTLFAFARDGGFPGSQLVRKVHPATKTPHVAIVLVTVLPCVLVLATRTVSERAFFAATSLATTALYVSYGTPIALGAWARMRGRWKHKGPFDLKRFGVPVAILAVLWAMFVVLVFFIPPNLPFGLVLASLVVFLAAMYFLLVRGRFAGPKVDIASLERS
jgi:amino acid transporter